MMPALLISTSSGPRRSSAASRKRYRPTSEIGCRALGQLQVDVADRDLRPLAHERRGGGTADAPSAAGDRDDLAGEGAGLRGHVNSFERGGERTGCPASLAGFGTQRKRERHVGGTAN
jgi:hypothetical protein